MDVTFGLITFLVLVLFPGLLFRKLYFYGPFSKQFSAGLNLISLNAISIVPGLVSLLLAYAFYDSLISEVDLGAIIDKLKEINNPTVRFKESGDTPVRELLNRKAIPFIGSVYLVSIFLGVLSGRLVRNFGIDKKTKLLRFSNIWFYYFKLKYIPNRSPRYLRENGKKHLFTNADILIATNNEQILYSGIVIDYELDSNNCQELNKIVLKDAKRYHLEDGKRVPVEIPGDLFILDCSSMLNINLTHIYRNAVKFIDSRWPNVILRLLAILCIIIIPLFIFKVDGVNLSFYNAYFELPLYKKIIAYGLVVQLIATFIPFRSDGEKPIWANWKTVVYDIILLAAFTGLLIIL